MAINTHIAELPAPFPAAHQLVLTGERIGRSFIIFSNGMPHFVQPAPFTVLIQLTTARRELFDGFVDTNKLVPCLGCEVYGRKLISRLNQQAGDIVETSWSQHRLIMQEDEILVCEHLFDVPKGLIDKATLDALADSLRRDSE